MEELAEHDIGLDGHFLDLRRVRPLSMTHVIVGRETDGQHIGGIALTQLFGLDGAFGEALDQLVAERTGFDCALTRAVANAVSIPVIASRIGCQPR